MKKEGNPPSIIESLRSNGYTLKPDQSTILVGYIKLPNNDGSVTVTPYYRHIPAGSKQPISAQAFSTVTF